MLFDNIKRAVDWSPYSLLQTVIALSSDDDAHDFNRTF